MNTEGNPQATPQSLASHRDTDVSGFQGGERLPLGPDEREKCLERDVKFERSVSRRD
jgi:hypothetical protein